MTAQEVQETFNLHRIICNYFGVVGSFSQDFFARNGKFTEIAVWYGHGQQDRRTFRQIEISREDLIKHLGWVAIRYIELVEDRWRR